MTGLNALSNSNQLESWSIVHKFIIHPMVAMKWEYNEMNQWTAVEIDESMIHFITFSPLLITDNATDPEGTRKV